jgi:hypothetical protein
MQPLLSELNSSSNSFSLSLSPQSIGNQLRFSTARRLSNPLLFLFLTFKSIEY